MESVAEEQAGNAQGLDAVEGAEAPVPTGRPADRIRAAVEETADRGAPMISAQVMQEKLFAVYDDARAEPEALALVQRHLQLTLERSWYSAKEVEDLADQLDWLLGLAFRSPVDNEPATARSLTGPQSAP
jgi:hypothetical protein